MLGGGCAAVQNGTYPTLRQTDVRIHWLMVRYRNAADFSALTPEEQHRANAAYAEYQTAFTQALQDAHGNYDAPTPDNVKALANNLIEVVSAIPLSTYP
jgi:hypothetical protein